MTQASIDLEVQHNSDELLTFFISGQQFGIPILQVQDVLRAQAVTPIPLSNHEIEGVLNLRGRVVTAINVRKRLGLDKQDDNKGMSIVVEHSSELFSLIIDSVGDVMRLKKDDFERNPATLDPIWREFSRGIYQLDNNLLIVLDIAKLLAFEEI